MIMQNPHTHNNTIEQDSQDPAALNMDDDVTRNYEERSHAILVAATWDSQDDDDIPAQTEAEQLQIQTQSEQTQPVPYEPEQPRDEHPEEFPGDGSGSQLNFDSQDVNPPTSPRQNPDDWEAFPDATQQDDGRDNHDTPPPPPPPPGYSLSLSDVTERDTREALAQMTSGHVSRRDIAPSWTTNRYRRSAPAPEPPAGTVPLIIPVPLKAEPDDEDLDGPNAPWGQSPVPTVVSPPNVQPELPETADTPTLHAASDDSGHGSRSPTHPPAPHATDSTHALAPDAEAFALVTTSITALSDTIARLETATSAMAGRFGATADALTSTIHELRGRIDSGFGEVARAIERNTAVSEQILAQLNRHFSVSTRRSDRDDSPLRDNRDDDGSGSQNAASSSSASRVSTRSTVSTARRGVESSEDVKTALAGPSTGQARDAGQSRLGKRSRSDAEGEAPGKSKKSKQDSRTGSGGMRKTGRNGKN